jgi:hypothetical protein
VLGPGHSCSVSVHFSPSTDGKAIATIKVNDDALNGPQTISVTGVGK